MDNNSAGREEVDIMLERYSVTNVKYVKICYNVVENSLLWKKWIVE